MANRGRCKQSQQSNGRGKYSLPELSEWVNIRFPSHSRTVILVLQNGIDMVHVLSDLLHLELFRNGQGLCLGFKQTTVWLQEQFSHCVALVRRPCW